MQLRKCDSKWLMLFKLIVLFSTNTVFSELAWADNEKSSALTSTSRGGWQYFVKKDDFTNESICVISKTFKNSNPVGVESEKTLQIKGYSEFLKMVAFEFYEKEEVKSYDPEFGMINKGPYTPWPELTKNADIKIGEEVFDGHIGVSKSTAKDVFTRGVWERSTPYLALRKPFHLSSHEDDLQVRIEGEIYTVPKPLFQRFKTCIELQGEPS